MPERFVVAVLAGGQSRRMGFDKTAARIGGISLLERAVRAAGGAGLRVLVSGTPRPAGWTATDVFFVLDHWWGCGPLSGITTALRHAAGTWPSPPAGVLALACDIPLVTSDALLWLAAQAAEHSDEHGVIVEHDGRLEPLFGIYREACLPYFEEILQGCSAEATPGSPKAEALSLKRVIEEGRFGRVAAPDWLAAQLVNVNTPEELAALDGVPPAKAHPPSAVEKSDAKP